MTTIKNNTKKPLSVPLPAGKRLFLGPGKSGQIAAKAVDYPQLQELVASGDVEFMDGDDRGKGRGRANGSSNAAGQRQNQAKTVFRSGDN